MSPFQTPGQNMRCARLTRRRDIALRSARPARTPDGRNIIVGIGIDRYRHRPPLANAVHDAIAACQLFQRMGFEHITPPLLDDRATAAAIQQLVTDDLRTLHSNDSLVVFYSGHGATEYHRLGDHVIRTGYFIPVDAQDKVAGWIELESWLRAVALLPPRHILVILDACHSGIALDPLARCRPTASSRDAARGARPAAPTALAARRSRRVITSALADEVASDDGPLPGHSLFTGCLLEALADGVAPSGGVGGITGSELALRIQRRVASYPGARQTPDFGAFAFDDRGELTLPVRVAAATLRGVAPARDRSRLGTGGGSRRSVG